MNFFTISSLLIVITNLLMAGFLFYRGHSKKISLLWGRFCLVVAVWGLGAFMASLAKSMESSFFWWQFANISSLLAPTLFCHFVLTYLGKPKRFFIISIYCIAFCVLLVNFFARHLFIGELSFMFNQFYYIDWTNLRTPLYLTFYLFFYWILLPYSFLLLLKRFFHSKGQERNQLKYFILGMLMGFSGAHLLWLPAFGVNVYPYSNILIAFYPVIIGYAILRYRLMDIRVAITRAGIFILVYSLVLGFPLWLGYKYQLWLYATWAMLVLATAGPSIYIYLQKKAEERILQEEGRIQEFLTQASYRINRIKELPKLLEAIIDLVFKTLNVSNVSLYMLDSLSQQYILKAGKHRPAAPDSIEGDSPFIHALKQQETPLVYEEFRLQSDAREQKQRFLEAIEQIKTLRAQVIVPMHRFESLIGFLVLGDREDKGTYSPGILNALTILANHASPAIENCQYLEAQTKRMEEEGFHERIASLDMMASSFAHEIDNPMAVVKSETEFLINEFFEEIKGSLTEEKQKEFKEITAYILESSIRVSAMVKAIEEYSRMGTGELKPVRVNDAVDGFLTLINPQFKKEKIKFIQNVDEKLPFILGEKVQLEEIFMNFATNAMHAVRNNKEKIITLKIFQKDDTTVKIEFSDSGYGIPPKIINDIFLASVTTKGSSEGTGLGLFRVRKIVDLHKGKAWAQSRGEGQGAQFIVELPIYKGDIRDTIKNNNNHQ